MLRIAALLPSRALDGVCFLAFKYFYGHPNRKKEKSQTDMRGINPQGGYKGEKMYVNIGVYSIARGQEGNFAAF